MGITPARLVNPTVGLIPTTEFSDAGQSIEPSVSVPSVTAVMLAAAAIAVVALVAGGDAYQLTKPGTVISYDRRSLMVDGQRDIFFSGSIHYPRSPFHEWPDLIARAKEGGSGSGGSC